MTPKERSSQAGLRPTTVDEVRQWLRSWPDRAPSVVIGTEADGKPGRDNVFTLTHLNDGRWRVAYFERGSFDDARYFATEADACRDFVQMLAPRRDVTEASRAWEKSP